MRSSPRHAKGWLALYYDKVVLFVVLLTLAASSFYLVLRLVVFQREWAATDWEGRSVTPKNVRPLDLSQFTRIEADLKRPYQSTQTLTRLMISELRVSCVECGKPIVFDAAKCPFCGKVQPVIPDIKTLDTDGDGLPDEYEKIYGLNPVDEKDAQQDQDKDGFTALEEYLATPRTNPKDPKESPDPIAKLRLIRIASNPFKLRFQGVQVIGTNELFQLNLRTLERTYFKRMGETVEGFTLVSYNPTNATGPVLVLKQEGNEIPLVKGRAITQFEMVADLIFMIDRSRIRVKVNDVFPIKNVSYKVIDIGRGGVLIRNEKNGQDAKVAQLTETEKEMIRAGLSMPAPSAAPVAPSEVPEPTESQPPVETGNAAEQ